MKKFVLYLFLCISSAHLYAAAGPECELSFEEEKTRVEILIERKDKDISDACEPKNKLAARGGDTLTHFFYYTDTNPLLQKELRQADSIEKLQLVEQRRRAANNLLIQMMKALNITGDLLIQIQQAKTADELSQIEKSIDLGV